MNVDIEQELPDTELIEIESGLLVNYQAFLHIKKLKERVQELSERIKLLSPPLPDEMRERSKTIWRAATFAHESGKPGEPGPMAIIASALRDAESRGMKKVSCKGNCKSTKRKVNKKK